MMDFFAQNPPRTIVDVDAGCRRATGRDPTDDTDHAFDVEDVEASLLANRVRNLKKAA